MSINKELNENELENFYGGPVKANDLPDKFKEVEKDPDELDMDQLEKVYAGPIKHEDLPEDYFTSKDQEIKH